MSDISVRSTATLGNEDQRWIGPGGRTALRDNQTVTLDRSAFDFVTKFPNGYIPSGVTLAKVTATGLYGPYGGTTDEAITLTESGSGLTSWTVTFGGQTTASIDDDATATQVQAALELLSTIGAGNVAVTGGPLATGAFTVTFQGTLADTNVGDVTTTPTGGTGAVDVAVVTTGGTDIGVGGLETAVGFLAVTVAVDPLSAATADIPAALYWHGQVVESYLPTGHGLDAAGRTELAAKFRFI